MVKLWPTIEGLHRRYVTGAAWVAVVLGIGYGLAAVARSSLTLAGSSLALFVLAGIAAWQLRSDRPRLDILVGLGGLALIAAAFVRDPAVLVAALLAYTVFAAAASYLGGRWSILWFGAVILAAGVVTILRMQPPAGSAVLAIAVLTVGNGVGGFMHRQTGRLLRSQVAKFDALFESAPDGIVVSDVDGRVLAVNETFVEMFGLESGSDVVGGTWDRFMPSRLRADYSKLIHDFVSSGDKRARSGTSQLLLGLRADGTEFPIEVSMAKVAFDHQTVLKAIVRDVTERVESVRQLEEMAEARLQLLASVSHEVRTPLTAVLGFAELLRTGDDLSADEREGMIKEIASEANDMANLVEDLLVGARAELGELEVVEVPVRLVAQVNQVLESLRLSVPVVAEGEVIAQGDPGRIRQILRNLISNAQHYGGPDLRIHVGRRQDQVYIAVSDDGPPLSDGDQQRIFERFHVAQPQQGQPGPVGIGLFLSRVLAEKMHGDLTYRYEQGRTIFELALPASPGRPVG